MPLCMRTIMCYILQYVVRNIATKSDFTQFLHLNQLAVNTDVTVYNMAMIFENRYQKQDGFVQVFK